MIVQRRCTSRCSSVENIPLQAEHHSARRQQLFAFPPESAFTFRPECCSESQRNRVRLQNRIAFTFDRIPQHKIVAVMLDACIPLEKRQEVTEQLAEFNEQQWSEGGWMVIGQIVANTITLALGFVVHALAS